MNKIQIETHCVHMTVHMCACVYRCVQCSVHFISTKSHKYEQNLNWNSLSTHDCTHCTHWMCVQCIQCVQLSVHVYKYWNSKKKITKKNLHELIGVWHKIYTSVVNTVDTELQCCNQSVNLTYLFKTKEYSKYFFQ